MSDDELIQDMHDNPAYWAEQYRTLETKLAAAEVYMEAMTHALHGISLCSQNSMSDKRECGKIARRALATTEDAK